MMIELQTDCLTRYSANHTEQAQTILEQSDIEEGLNAAAAISDDRIRRQAQGYLMPVTEPTHGNSQQQLHSFPGKNSSRATSGAYDTFNADRY